MIPFLFLAAHAEPVFSCEGVFLEESVPSAGATDVPVDVRVALVFALGCDTGTGWTATLAGPDGTPVPTRLGDGSEDAAATQLIELFPDAPLAADTAYTLTVTPPDGAGETTEIGFQTGSGSVAGLSGEPTMRIDRTFWSEGA